MSAFHFNNGDDCKRLWFSIISLTCKLGWHCRSSNIFTTPICPLLTPICKAVCRLLLRAFKSAPACANNCTTDGSSPKAAWWTALSPSLSSISTSAWYLSSTDITSKWPFWLAACRAVWPAKTPFTSGPERKVEI